MFSYTVAKSSMKTLHLSCIAFLVFLSAYSGELPRAELTDRMDTNLRDVGVGGVEMTSPMPLAAPQLWHAPTNRGGGRLRPLAQPPVLIQVRASIVGGVVRMLPAKDIGRADHAASNGTEHTAASTATSGATDVTASSLSTGVVGVLANDSVHDLVISEATLLSLANTSGNRMGPLNSMNISENLHTGGSQSSTPTQILDDEPTLNASLSSPGKGLVTGHGDKGGLRGNVELPALTESVGSAWPRVAANTPGQSQSATTSSSWGTSWGGCSLALRVVSLVVLGLLFGLRLAQPWSCTASASLDTEVNRLRVVTSADLQRLFELDHGTVEPSTQGVLVRVEGKVVAKADGLFTAPFSGNLCVYYAASVSQPRSDGVHCPPLAFHSAGNDFLIQLSGASQISLTVRGRDVSLFDMASGTQDRLQTFASASAPWRAFVLDHLVPSADASQHFGCCSDLGPTGSALEFRERALMPGCMVTCVGEVVRGAHGGLVLQPWRPKLLAPRPAPLAEAAPPWLRILAPCLGSPAPPATTVLGDNVLAGKVAISDEPGLLGKTGTSQAPWNVILKALLGRLTHFHQHSKQSCQGSTVL